AARPADRIRHQLRQQVGPQQLQVRPLQPGELRSAMGVMARMQPPLILINRESWVRRPRDSGTERSNRRLNVMTTLTRRHFLQYGVGAGAALALPGAARPGSAAAANNVASRLTKYLEPLPVPGAGVV